MVTKEEKLQREVDLKVRHKLFDAALSVGSKKIPLMLPGDLMDYISSVADLCGYPFEVVLNVLIAQGLKKEEDAGRFVRQSKKPVSKRTRKAKAARKS